jgi:hypothetical protein
LLAHHTAYHNASNPPICIRILPISSYPAQLAAESCSITSY